MTFKPINDIYNQFYLTELISKKDRLNDMRDDTELFVKNVFWIIDEWNYDFYCMIATYKKGFKLNLINEIIDTFNLIKDIIDNTIDITIYKKKYKIRQFYHNLSILQRLRMETELKILI